MAVHSSPARAHEFWLAPSAYVASVGDTVRVSAFSGMGFRGEARRYAHARVVRFVAVDAERTDLADSGLEGDSVFASVVARDAGGLLIAYESNAASIELPGAEFDRYLEEDGLDVPLALRRASGVKDGLQRERYARRAKTWVSGPSWRRACTVTGLALELVPLADPGCEQHLSLRVLFRGRPLVGGGGAGMAPAARTRHGRARASQARLGRLRGRGALGQAGRGAPAHGGGRRMAGFLRAHGAIR